MALCPAYGGSICSLCCSLDARCHDQCKEESRLSEQVGAFLNKLLPPRIAVLADTRGGRFVSLLLLSNLLVGLVLAFIYAYVGGADQAARTATGETLWMVYFSFLVLSASRSGSSCSQSRTAAAPNASRRRQTSMLMDEIAAHNRTDARCNGPRRSPNRPTWPSRATSSACRTRSARR